MRTVPRRCLQVLEDTAPYKGAEPVLLLHHGVPWEGLTRMKIAVVGTGYVGLVVGACLADNGNEVICVDNDAGKIRALRRGRIPIYEPGLAEIVSRNQQNTRLAFSTSLARSVRASEIVFIAVGTPPDEDGSADLRHVLDVATGIGRALNGYKVVVTKSTVPAGTASLDTRRLHPGGEMTFSMAGGGQPEADRRVG